MTQSDVKCRVCDMPIRLINHSWIVMDTGTTADGLSFCPPDPDHQGELSYHEPPCRHEWAAGMMVVHPEDLQDLIDSGRHLECTNCDETIN